MEGHGYCRIELARTCLAVSSNDDLALYRVVATGCCMAVQNSRCSIMGNKSDLVQSFHYLNFQITIVRELTGSSHE